MQTKIIEISTELYEALDSCKDRYCESGWESKCAIIKKLLARYDSTCQLKHEDGYYWFVVKDRKRKFPELSTIMKKIRITQDLLDSLNEAKVHPDETVNTVLQRLLFSHYSNKLVYRINIGSIRNRDVQELMFFIDELLMTEPKFNNSLLVEVASAENYPEIKDKCENNVFPSSILYDLEGNEVWQMKGKHDFGKLREKLEQFIDSYEESVPSSLKIPLNIS